MGCDIWTYIEKKNPENGKWEQLKIYRKDKGEYKVIFPYDWRGYNLFSLLAGVRGWYEPLVPPRGLPKDLGEEVSKEWEDMEGGGHTPTWYDLRELELCYETLPDKEAEEYEGEYTRKELLKSFICNLITYIEYSGNFWWGDEVGKYRVIIWFDN